MDKRKEEELFTTVLINSWNQWQFQIFTGGLISLWNRWQLRLLVLLSFAVQATLIILGNKRKSTTSNPIKIVIWLVYMMADSVAVLALGIFSQTNQAVNNIVLVLWIPLLLLHLGGPDAITAYSMEDNELWLRQLLRLVIQVVGSFYVFIKAWNTNSPLTYIALPLFVAGIIKYAERIYALRSATYEQFRRWTRDHCNFLHPETAVINQLEVENSFSRISNRDFIHTSYIFLKAAGTLLTDEPNYEMNRVCASLIKKNSFDDVFLINEIILGLLYEWFYTKMQVFFSLRGFHLRFLCINCLVSALVVFSIINKHGYNQVDVVISYILLVGGVFLEFFSLEVFFRSDWLVIHLIVTEEKERDFYKSILITIKRIFRCEVKVHRKRWSCTLGRFNLLEFLSQINPAGCNIPESLYKHIYKTTKPLPSELKKRIYTELVVDQRETFSEWKQIRRRYYNEEFGWAFPASFSDSILNWHVATDLLSVLDNNVAEDPKRRMSQLISEYMVYLLEMCPSMILGPGRLQGFKILEQAPDWFGVFPRKITEQNKKEVYVELLRKCNSRNSEIQESKRFQLISAIQLANVLDGRRCTKEQTWEMILQVWLDMLFYAARQCGWEVHVQYLRRGGEFLTHVWLLTLHGALEKEKASSSYDEAKVLEASRDQELP